MIKKIFCLCTVFALIFSISGCKKDYKVSNPTKDVQQSKNETSTSVTSNNSETSTTPIVSSSSEVNEDYNLQEYMFKKDKILLAGKINNNLDIHMELKMSDKDHFEDISDRYYDSNMSMENANVVTRYEGTYYYDKYMKNIRIEAQAYSNGYINIFEFDEKNQLSGSFGGFIFQGKILKGMWNDNNIPKYQFYLVKSDIKTDGMDLNLDTNRIGSYSRVGSSSNNLTTLIIYSVSDDEVKFHISGYSKPNIGEMGGVATYTDSSKKTAQLYDKENNLKITLEFYVNKVKLEGNDVLKSFAGAHVTMSGTFVK